MKDRLGSSVLEVARTSNPVRIPIDLFRLLLRRSLLALNIAVQSDESLPAGEGKNLPSCVELPQAGAIDHWEIIDLNQVFW
jgi:hypothetical protein